MAHSIALPEDLYRKLEKLAQPFRDHEPIDVIHRLADEALSRVGRDTGRRVSEGRSGFAARVPRTRGIEVAIDGVIIRASTVPDLYEQVLSLLERQGKTHDIQRLLPYKTSSRRFLIAAEPRHPNGRPFVVVVKHSAFFMEAHKSYQTAVLQLSAFLQHLGVQLVVRAR
jgi:hypothetical protein